MRALRLAAQAGLALGLAATAAPAPAHASACKLALVLALDISSSVNAKEYAIQLGGLADAFRVPAIRDAILSPPGAGIAVTAFEWSGQFQQSLIAPWTMLDDEAAIDAFADRLTQHERSADDQSTAIGSALGYAAVQLSIAPPCPRQTVDVSGDGVTNEGPSPDMVRASGLLAGVTINGLVIVGRSDDAAIHYREEVMQGPDAFVALARDFDDYPPVIIGKLLREIEDAMVLGAAR